MNSEGEYILPDNVNFSDMVVDKYCNLFEGKVKPIYESEMKRSSVRSDKNQRVSQTETHSKENQNTNYYFGTTWRSFFLFQIS